MAIPATTPTVIPETTYDHWWITSLNLAANPANPNTVSVNVALTKCNEDEYGTVTLSKTERTSFSVPDLFAAITDDPELATVMASLVNKVQAMATARNLI